MTAPAHLPPAAPRGHAQRTALWSVIAAVVLVAVKLTAGVLSGSLGLVAEAAHSATDLIAALLTLLAIRVALRPADEQHQYGHGKAEHLAALAESGFLFLVSAAVGVHAMTRLVGDGSHDVDAAWWTFAVLALVVAIDAGRAVASHRAARRHNSAALAANALHFASDLLGSVAVAAGLVLTAAGEPRADAVAALIVSALVCAAAGKLARESVDVLMDRTSTDAHEAIRAALSGRGLGADVRRVRVRSAAGTHFVDLVVTVPADAAVTQAHAAADTVEAAVRAALPSADVVVHVEPRAAGHSLRERATSAALEATDVREVHNVRVIHVAGRYELSLHVKLQPALTLTQAHDIVEALEAGVHAAVPELHTVRTHIEPLTGVDWARNPAASEVEAARLAVGVTVERHTGYAPLGVTFRDGDRGRVAFVDVALPGEQPLPSAHRCAGLIEHEIRDRCPELADVIVHTEPA